MTPDQRLLNQSIQKIHRTSSDLQKALDHHTKATSIFANAVLTMFKKMPMLTNNKK